MFFVILAVIVVACIILYFMFRDSNPGRSYSGSTVYIDSTPSYRSSSSWSSSSSSGSSCDSGSSSGSSDSGSSGGDFGGGDCGGGGASSDW